MNEEEIREALKLTPGEQLQLREKCEWQLKRIEVVVEEAIMQKVAPLIIKLHRRIERLENK